METHRNFLKNSQIIILGLCLAAATVASSLIFSKALLQMKKFSGEVINVTGAAEKTIKSDYIVWTSRFIVRDPQMTAAYQKLKENLLTVKEYLRSKGVREEEIIIDSVETEILYQKNEKGADTHKIEAYRLSQRLEVRSANVDHTTAVSREATELINQGIEFISDFPGYYYTRLAELKLQMLAEATENAKKRAEQMAAATGNKVGVMRSARMGVFQITPVNSAEVSDWGVNDTQSLDKKVMAVVKIDFAIL
ncbi:MAG TPA: SIMPL domain-containing protein [bacterium]|nr:SIMPL domain-containing protein [bacterium]